MQVADQWQRRRAGRVVPRPATNIPKLEKQDGNDGEEEE